MWLFSFRNHLYRFALVLKSRLWSGNNSIRPKYFYLRLRKFLRTRISHIWGHMLLTLPLSVLYHVTEIKKTWLHQISSIIDESKLLVKTEYRLDHFLLQTQKCSRFKMRYLWDFEPKNNFEIPIWEIKSDRK